MSFITRIDNTIALIWQKAVPTKPGIISILIHGLFRDQNEVVQAQADPQQGIDLHDFEQIITYYHQRGYLFISADQLSTGLNPKKKYCLLTFDDGYFNNTHSIPILEKYNVPATFYVSTHNVLQQRSFWWDVYYRERRKLGVSIQTIREEKVGLKTKKISELETLFTNTYGTDAFKPINDIDRPITAQELADFARHPLVCIGNHTHQHIIFDNYTPDEIVSDIVLNQQYLTEITGKAPVSIAYPNGNIQQEIHLRLKEIGLLIGITTARGKNYFPFQPGSNAAYCIKRFTPWHGQLDCMLPLSETDLHVKSFFKRSI